MNDITAKLAHQAFDYFSQGWATGNFQPYIEMLSDEFTFWFPYGKHRGKFSGRAGKEQMVAKCRDHVEAGDRLTFSLPHHVTSNDTTMVFEFESQGTIDHQPYSGRNAISLTVTANRLSAFREYIGDIK